MFSVGDIICGKCGAPYSITDESMLRARVIEIEDDLKQYAMAYNNPMEIEIISHKNLEYNGDTYIVNNTEEEFSLISAYKNYEIASDDALTSLLFE